MAPVRQILTAAFERQLRTIEIRTPTITAFEIIVLRRLFVLILNLIEGILIVKKIN